MADLTAFTQIGGTFYVIHFGGKKRVVVIAKPGNYFGEKEWPGGLHLNDGSCAYRLRREGHTS